MFNALFELFSSGFLFFALHLSGGNSFPKPLSAEEEKQCLALHAQGDKAAREKLISHNLRLVAHLVKRYYANAADQEDLISIGSIGLIKAVDSFHPEKFPADKRPRLSTYAARCIENEILMHFRAQKKVAHDVSLEEPIETDGDGNPLTLGDILCSPDTLEADVLGSIESERMRGIVQALESPRERLILVRHYGLDGREPMTQNELAKALGISRSYISRIESKALARVRQAMGTRY
ncbi:MAG: sigma-70 family RNA polymerase sigma factor [Oscillospiraceae bacterium]|jgi:RNA polymerase sporulation-specific sigma factor|nr:sigma-70 family RNA polymerase sigma factor [Oscillospiraceae bacterium]